MGLQEVTHQATRQRLDRSNGLLSHYRVFTVGKRYGGGAWDWPSTARLLDDAAVEVSWPEAEGRPFSMQATYRWRDASTVDLETTVRAAADLRGFEAFVASYFHERFTNAMVAAKAPPDAASAGGASPDATVSNSGSAAAANPAAGTNAPVLVRALRSEGDWQMFPRDVAAIPLIQDGRWKLEPNPVDWTLRSELVRPLVRRRAPSSGLSCVLMAPSEECFAVSMPYEAEGHGSAYLSLFGKDLRAGDMARARARLVVAVAKPDAALFVLYEEASKDWESRPAAGDGR